MLTHIRTKIFRQEKKISINFLESIKCRKPALATTAPLKDNMWLIIIIPLENARHTARTVSIL